VLISDHISAAPPAATASTLRGMRNVIKWVYAGPEPALHIEETLSTPWLKDALHADGSAAPS
jgi:hypothetical protein